jgi:hypothetical protein
LHVLCVYRERERERERASERASERESIYIESARERERDSDYGRYGNVCRTTFVNNWRNSPIIEPKGSGFRV